MEQIATRSRLLDRNDPEELLTRKMELSTQPRKEADAWRDVTQKPVVARTELEIYSDSDTEHDKSYFLKAVRATNEMHNAAKAAKATSAANKENTEINNKDYSYKAPFSTSTPAISKSSFVVFSERNLNQNGNSSLRKLTQTSECTPIHTDSQAAISQPKQHEDISLSSLMESLRSQSTNPDESPGIASDNVQIDEDDDADVDSSPSLPRRIRSTTRRQVESRGLDHHNELKDELSDAYSKIRLLEARVGELETTAYRRDRDLGNAQFKLERDEVEIHELKNHISEQDNDIKALRDEHLELKRQGKVMAMSTGEHDSLKLKLEESEKELEELREKLRKADKVAQASEDLLKQIGSLQKENERLASKIGTIKPTPQSGDEALDIASIESFTLADCYEIISYIVRQQEVSIGELLPWLGYQKESLKCHGNFANKTHLLYYSEPRRADLGSSKEIQKLLREGANPDRLIADLVQCLTDMLKYSKDHMVC
ncbi:unnamed protein product [Kuraishia capsulata CBS 1993]|uniref:Uncharacterized protein n=1 Tax=Kuraishia capsulata CBS 1993 TaxID=1382522 RepID=W6MRX8_9ASCO|nr:uncharacterized protein KUCA_T00000546001 [Kuraishia capsulata CBS 1993]CDK24580.1 unnamed protein product [Kuraishia capsulata CBS 1993]